MIVGDLVRHDLDTEKRLVGVIIEFYRNNDVPRKIVLVQWSSSPKVFNENIIDETGPHWHWIENLKVINENR
jgi:hypothetical protein|tara:strand:- start:33 stop:248 length:216 start_codon:yes stop_codon:yes gene_type:complete